MPLSIADIEIGQRKRSAGDVRELAGSIARIGLLNPITACYQIRSPGGLSNEKGPVLIAGLRRLEACKLLGHTEIEANVVELYGRDLELAEIDENLIREDLTALERVEQLQRRKFIYGLTGGKKIPTSAGGREFGFAKDAEESTGMTKRTINQDIKIADGIPKKLRDELRGTDMEDSREDLRALAKAKDDPAAQRKAVKAFKKGKVENLREALEEDKSDEAKQTESLERAWAKAKPSARHTFNRNRDRDDAARYRDVRKPIPDVDDFTMRLAGQINSHLNNQEADKLAQIIDVLQHVEDEPIGEMISVLDGLIQRAEKFKLQFKEGRSAAQTETIRRVPADAVETLAAEWRAEE